MIKIQGRHTIRTPSNYGRVTNVKIIVSILIRFCRENVPSYLSRDGLLVFTSTKFSTFHLLTNDLISTSTKLWQRRAPWNIRLKIPILVLEPSSRVLPLTYSIILLLTFTLKKICCRQSKRDHFVLWRTLSTLLQVVELILKLNLTVRLG